MMLVNLLAQQKIFQEISGGKNITDAKGFYHYSGANFIAPKMHISGKSTNLKELKKNDPPSNCSIMGVCHFLSFLITKEKNGFSQFLDNLF